MSDLSQEAQAIINAARDADAPTAADRDRVGVARAERLDRFELLERHLIAPFLGD